VKYDEESDSETRTDIGFIEVWRIEGTRAIDDGLDIVEICDDIERELYEYALSVYKNGCIDDELVEMPRSQDVLVLHRIEINKEFQGRKLGILISQKIIAYLGYTCGAILIRPCPMQYSDVSKEKGWKEKYFSDKFNVTKAEGTKNLKKYWKRVNPYIKNANGFGIICIPQG
jgi:hypothetical protein